MLASVRNRLAVVAAVDSFSDPEQQAAGRFAVEVLNKRLLSCPYTFANSWLRFKDGLEEAESAAASEVDAAEKSAEEDTADEIENGKNELATRGKRSAPG